MSRIWTTQRLLLVGALAATALACGTTQAQNLKINEVCMNPPGDEKNEFFEIKVNEALPFNFESDATVKYFFVAFENEDDHAGGTGPGIVDTSLQLTGTTSDAYPWGSTSTNTYGVAGRDWTFSPSYFEGTGATYMIIKATNSAAGPVAGTDYDDDDDGNLTDDASWNANWTVVDSLGLAADPAEPSYTLYGSVNIACESAGNVLSSNYQGVLNTVISFVTAASLEGNVWTEGEFVGRNRGEVPLTVNLTDNGIYDFEQHPVTGTLTDGASNVQVGGKWKYPYVAGEDVTTPGAQNPIGR